MAVRRPLTLEQPTGIVQPQIYQMIDELIDNVHGFATYAYAQDPSVNLEVDTANGTLMGGQPFVDTYYVAGAYTTRVDRFATEAETADIVLTTDNYNRLRLVNDTVVLPSGDTNNFQYPLVLWNETYGYDITNANADDLETHLRAMTRADFIDTFVTPALDRMETDGFYNGAQTIAQNGTHFITTSSNPSNATLVSTTPVAVNSEANVSAYTASGIPEAVKQTIDINYYIAKVDFPATAYALYDSEQGSYDLPLYFDAGTETIKQHTPTSWANLLGPWLRYYMATVGSGYNYTYNLTGTGNQKGSTYVDTRLTNSSTYQQRYVGLDDYRTQEFPNGTQTTVAGSQKALYLERGGTPSYGASASPSGSVTEGGSVTFTLTTNNVLDGTTFNYAITGITAADISSGSLSGTVTISGGSGSTTITLVGFDGTETETATCTFTTPGGNRTAQVTVVDLTETVSLEGTTGTPEDNSSLPLSDGSLQLGWKFATNGDIADYDNDGSPTDQNSGHVPWVNNSPPSGSYWIRASVHSQTDPGSQSFNNSPSAMNTWLALSSLRSFLFEDNRGTATYAQANVVLKIEIATDSGGTNIVATGYYRTQYEGGA